MSPVRELLIYMPEVRFPVLEKGGFGQLVVRLEPGESEVVDLGGTLVRVTRAVIH